MVSDSGLNITQPGGNSPAYGDADHFRDVLIGLFSDNKWALANLEESSNMLESQIANIDASKAFADPKGTKERLESRGKLKRFLSNPY